MWRSGKVRRGERSGSEYTLGVVEVKETWRQVMHRVESRLVIQRPLQGAAVYYGKAKNKKTLHCDKPVCSYCLFALDVCH